jgi:hypothetical protein
VVAVGLTPAQVARLQLETRSSDPVLSEEQVTQRAAEEIGDSTPRQMMRTVVDQVAALTKAAQVAQPIVGRIMIKMRGGKHDMRVRIRTICSRSGQRAMRPRRSRHVCRA